ncbi:MAG TPA: SRPBCC family protein [Vineibacter sp.]|nr:SRPBCC family protein [Vineibacter sp.]
MADPAAVTARVTRRFTASAERVFDAWLDPAKAGKFLFATATGQMVRVEIDARVGGMFTFVDRRDGEDVPHTGKYIEIDRPRRLVFSLAVEKYSQDIDRVAIDIVPLDSGCELTLTHEMRPDWSEHRDRIQAGWGEILEGLAITLG